MKISNTKFGGLAGICLIIMAIAAGFSFGYIHADLVVATPGQTLMNILKNQSLFFAELSGWLVIFITDLVVALGLYFLFSSTSKKISLLTAATRILYTIILGVAIYQLFKVVPFLSLPDIESNSAYPSEVDILFSSFDTIWSLGLIIFGFHLLGLGYLCMKFKAVPYLFAYLLYFGGVGYIVVHSLRHLHLLNPEHFLLIENILAFPMGLSEVLFAFWLIYHSFKKQKNAA